jgi:hypothetical protein
VTSSDLFIISIHSKCDPIVYSKINMYYGMIIGANIQIATPIGYEPDADVIEETKRLAKVCIV